MKNWLLVFVFGLMPILSACDLHPKITNIPDSVGDFIETRYPALLADPDTQPEIYNSAATDYGVYASPELYGGTTPDDYVLYASVDDYILPPDDTSDDAELLSVPTERPQIEYVPDESDTEISDDFLSVPKYTQPTVQSKTEPEKNSGEIIVVRGDTLYALARANNTTVDALARENNLNQPYTLRVGQKLKLPSGKVSQPKPESKTAPKIEQKPIVKPEPKPVVKEIQKPAPKPAPKPKTTPKTTTRVNLTDITVGAGDTLYSLSRKYAVPVNDLAVINNLSAPFTLRVGQKIKVPNVAAANARAANVSTKTASPKPKTVTKPKSEPVKKKTEPKKESAKPKTQPVQTKSQTKISSDPTQKLPKIAARSSSKFSWPVRGKILSAYGTKSTGLFNDGINISASMGASVRAAENGVVAYAGNEVKGMGNLIIIQHSDGWMTVYAHLDTIGLRHGARVNVGDKIGTVGKTGKVSEPQLHFEIRRGTKSYNPTKYLK